jgi:holliday junction DNA helicase RuvB
MILEKWDSDKTMQQEEVLQLLKQRIERANAKQIRLDHILLCGERENTQAIFDFVSEHMQGLTRRITLPNEYRVGDIAAILTNLKYRSILYIDEIHRLEKSLIPLLASAMRDDTLDMVIGKASQAKNVRLNLPPFTVLAATTRPSLLSYQLHTLFPIEYQID